MISEAQLKELSDAWLSVAGHVISGAQTRDDFVSQFEGVLQNAMRQAAAIGARNAEAKQAA